MFLPSGVPGGPVELVLQIDATGHVTEVSFATETAPEVQQAIREALSRYEFEPARVGGEPVAAKVRFRLDVDASAPPAAAAEVTTPQHGRQAPPAMLAPPPEPIYGARAEVEPPNPGAASQVKLRGAELTYVPGTFGEPLRVVGTLPGVARSPFGLGFYVVRGAAFQNTGFFVDGFAVPILYHLGAGPAIIPSRLVGQLDFYAGGYPAEYGRYTAGVIALTTTIPEVDSFQLEFELDVLRASALMIAPVAQGKGTIVLGYRRSYYELILPLITDDVAVSYADFQAGLDYEITDDLRASLFVFGSRDFLDYRTDTGTGQTTGTSEAGARYSFDQALLALDWKPSKKFHLRWSGIVGPSSLSLGSSSTGSAGLSGDVTSIRVGQRLNARYSPRPTLTTTFGIDQSIFRYSLQSEAPSIREFPGIPSPEAGSPPQDAVSIQDRLWEFGVAPYLEQVFRPDPFVLTLGLRADYLRYGAVRTWTFDPRAVVRVRLLDGFTLKLASGIFAQPPITFQTSSDAANPKLQPDRALQNAVGAELMLPLALEVDTSVFYNYMWQLTRGTSRPVVTEDGSVSQRFFDDDGQGRAYGFEFLLRRQLQEGLFGWVSYTLSRSERFLENAAPVVFFYDQTHVFNLAISYAIGDFRFGAKFTMATGRPVLDVFDPSGEHTVFDADSNNFTPDSTGRRSRLPTFHQLDLRIDRNFVLGPLEGSIYVDVLNVYNAHNSEGYLYSFDLSQRGRLPGLPFLPTLGIRGVLR